MPKLSTCFASVILASLLVPTIMADGPIDIGNRLELFVDQHLVETTTGAAEFKMHRPVPQEVVLTTDKPWEGNTSAYYTIFQDGDRYRMYYRASHYDTEKKKATHPEFTCYAESKDGIHWIKPELGLFEFAGSKKNNIVWSGLGTHCFAPFKDTNPDCIPSEQYKALSRGSMNGKSGLFAFKSPDGIHWSLMTNEPVITKGAFDSQNLAFWDSHTKQYREYHRFFANGVRDIMTGGTTDFLKWPEPTPLTYPDAPSEHLYTNAVLPYPRAPHILLGFPTRYLPKQGSRVEPVLMASRDRQTFHRWPNALIPEDAPKDRKGNRSNYMTWGLLQLPGNDKQLSVYATEAYYTGPDSRVRRFTFRVDGFASASAPATGGTVLTKPLTFQGNQLVLNFTTAKAGTLRIEIQDDQGKPVPGFELNNCESIQGDSIEQTVAWKNGPDLSKLANRPIRLHIELTDADLYSFQFQQ
ncbi:MAG: hypothetical protein COA78_23330 [Blastopirellula sp.]|nr:MAG: hypothetical protein COA78_23330 [Blastopirellula sp.]